MIFSIALWRRARCQGRSCLDLSHTHAPRFCWCTRSYLTGIQRRNSSLNRSFMSIHSRLLGFVWCVCVCVHSWVLRCVRQLWHDSVWEHHLVHDCLHYRDRILSKSLLSYICIPSHGRCCVTSKIQSFFVLVCARHEIYMCAHAYSTKRSSTNKNNNNKIKQYHEMQAMWIGEDSAVFQIVPKSRNI